MKLVALKYYEVVAIEKDGAINLDVEHTKVISVPDDEEVALGWTYIPAPLEATVKVKLFHDPNPDPATVKQPIHYAVDENGVQYVAELLST